MYRPMMRWFCLLGIVFAAAVYADPDPSVSHGKTCIVADGVYEALTGKKNRLYLVIKDQEIISFYAVEKVSATFLSMLTGWFYDSDPEFKEVHFKRILAGCYDNHWFYAWEPDSTVINIEGGEAESLPKHYFQFHGGIIQGRYSDSESVFYLYEVGGLNNFSAIVGGLSQSHSFSFHYSASETESKQQFLSEPLSSLQESVLSDRECKIPSGKYQATGPGGDYVILRLGSEVTIHREENTLFTYKYQYLQDAHYLCAGDRIIVDFPDQGSVQIAAEKRGGGDQFNPRLLFLGQYNPDSKGIESITKNFPELQRNKVYIDLKFYRIDD